MPVTHTACQCGGARRLFLFHRHPHCRLWHCQWHVSSTVPNGCSTGMHYEHRGSDQLFRSCRQCRDTRFCPRNSGIPGTGNRAWLALTSTGMIQTRFKLICFLQSACVLGAHGGAGYTFGALAILVVLPPGRKPSRAQLSQPEKRAGHLLCHPHQGPRASSYHPWGARPPWRGAVSAAGSRPGRKNSPGGGLGEARRH